MEKILTYEGKQVNFKATAALPLRYKLQFGRDMFADIKAIQKCWHPSEDGEGGHFDETLNLDLVYSLVWAMAKTADTNIKPPMEWYDEFEAGLPVFKWFAELSEMLVASLTGTQKN